MNRRSWFFIFSVLVLLTAGGNDLLAQKFQVKALTEAGDTLPAAGVPVHLLSYNGAGRELPQLTITTDSLGSGDFWLGLPIQFQINVEGYLPVSVLITEGPPHPLIFFLKPAIANLDPQVITAQYAPTTADHSLYKVRVIDSKRIEAQAAVNLADLLSKELNIRLSQDNAIGATAMSMAGIGGQNVKILIDGVPMIGRMDGNLDLSQINLNNIERIEIVEGPLSVMYGTDALAGVVNLITKKGVTKKWQSGLHTYYESVGKYNVDLNAGLAIKLKNRIRFSAGRNFFDGWSPTPQIRSEVWRPKQQYFGNLIYERDLGKWKLTYSLNGLHETIENKGKPVVTSRRAYAFDEYFYTRRLDNTLQLNGYIQKERYLDFTFGYSHFDRTKNTFYKDLVSLEKNITPNREQQDTAVFRRMTARGVYSMNKAQAKFNYQLGYDIFTEWGFGQRILNNEQVMGDWAVFGSIEYRPIRRLAIRPGFRLSYNTLYPAPPTPAFNLRYDFNEKWALRTSYARGFRAPSLKELYLDFVDANHNITGNPKLKAEYSHYVSVGLQWKKVGKKSVTTAEASLYGNDLKDRIFLGQQALNGKIGDPNAPLPFTYVNLAGFTAIGAQANVRYRTQQLSIEAGTALNGNQVASQNVRSPMVFSPEMSLNTTYDLKKLKSRIALFYKFNGRLQSYAVVSENELMPFFVGSYQTIDATVSRNFWDNKIILTVGGKNLMNVQNVSAQSGGGAHTAGSSSQPIAMGRTFFAGLRFNW